MIDRRGSQNLMINWYSGTVIAFTLNTFGIGNIRTSEQLIQIEKQSCSIEYLTVVL